MNAVAFRNVKFISHSEQGGRGDGVQIMVHRGYAYIGHGYSNGISVIDVRDPKNPRPVAFLPCPPNTRAIHLQTYDDLLLAVNGPSMWTMQIDAQAYYSGSPADLLKGRQYTAGVRVYDIAHPAAPHLVCRRALRLRLDPLPRVYRSGAGDSRHGRANPARGRRQVVDSWHVDGRRRDAKLAQGPALRTAPRSRRRQPRL